MEDEGDEDVAVNHVAKRSRYNKNTVVVFDNADRMYVVSALSLLVLRISGLKAGCFLGEEAVFEAIVDALSFSSCFRVCSRVQLNNEFRGFSTAAETRNEWSSLAMSILVKLCSVEM